MSRDRLAWHGFLSSKHHFPVQDGRPSRTAHPHIALPSLFCSVTHHSLSEGSYPHAACTDPAIKYMTQKALVRACSAWAIRVSKADVGKGILLDRPLPFKLHQSYRLLRCFIRKKSGRVPRNADSFLLQIPCKKSAVMTVMTLTPRSASRYRGDAVMRLSSQPYVHP